MDPEIPVEFQAPEEWPDVLAKALEDNPWTYAAYVRGYGVIEFTGCKKHRLSGWVWLEGARPREFTANRGIEVRIDDLLWLSDAQG